MLLSPDRSERDVRSPLFQGTAIVAEHNLAKNRLSIQSVYSTRSTSTTKSRLRDQNVELFNIIKGLSAQLEHHTSLLEDIHADLVPLKNRVSQLETGLEFTRYTKNMAEQGRRKRLSAPTESWWSSNKPSRVTVLPAKGLPTSGPGEDFGKSLERRLSNMHTETSRRPSPANTTPDLTPDREQSPVAGRPSSPTLADDLRFQSLRIDFGPRTVSEARIKTTEVVVDPYAELTVPTLQRAPSPKNSTRSSSSSYSPTTPSDFGAAPIPAASLAIVPRTRKTPVELPKLDTTLPERMLQPPSLQRNEYYRGVRSLQTYEMKVFNKKTNKEDTILIHIHNKKQLEELEKL